MKGSSNCGDVHGQDCMCIWYQTWYQRFMCLSFGTWCPSAHGVKWPGCVVNKSMRRYSFGHPGHPPPSSFIQSNITLRMMSIHDPGWDMLDSFYLLWIGSKQRFPAHEMRKMLVLGRWCLSWEGRGRGLCLRPSYNTLLSLTSATAMFPYIGR